MPKAFSLLSLLILFSCSPPGDEASGSKWPRKAIEISCFAAQGGGTDQICRMVAQAMEADLGVKINVVNREAGRGGAAINHVWSGKHDGHRWGGFSESVLPGSVLGITETTAKDWTFFMVAGAPGVLSVKADSPVQSLQELVARAEANPGGIKLAAGLTGGLWHTKMIALQSAASIHFNFIPFQGSQPSQLAALSGEVDAVLTSVSEQAELIKGGRLRPLAMIELEAFPFPGGATIPSAVESYPGIASVPVSQFLGFALPADTAPEILARIQTAFEKAMESDLIKKHAGNNLLSLLGKSGAEADSLAQAAEKAWTWKLQELGIATRSPADLGIERP
ncbi:MAG: tripartite tricarboxylate transporter substrate binding protein [Verrucomicrobiota bacterium]